MGISPAARATLRHRHRQLSVPYLRDSLVPHSGRRADYSVSVRLLGDFLLAYTCPALVGGVGRLGGVHRHDTAAGDSLPGGLCQRILQLFLWLALHRVAGRLQLLRAEGGCLASPARHAALHDGAAVPLNRPAGVRRVPTRHSLPVAPVQWWDALLPLRGAGGGERSRWTTNAPFFSWLLNFLVNHRRTQNW
jgi:hypothetical protein